ncbi:hypothetical protein D3C71_1645200 [compost metagenome]
MFTPRASSTSALPALPEAERFPCLATLTEAADEIIAEAVEILNLWMPEPPVPQVSNKRARSVSTDVPNPLIASAKPVISSTVSPLIRKAVSSEPICACEASPSIIAPIISRASVRVRFLPSISPAIPD